MRKELLRAALEPLDRDRREPRPLVVKDRTGSTNDDAREAAEAGAPAGALFVADCQTRGRGRRGREWFSPPGENVYLSLVLRPQACEPERLAAVTLAAGMAVADVVDAALGAARAGIKWPNDVYVDGRKIAGVLVEALSRGGEPPLLIVGVGLDVLTTDFVGELRDRATSLALCGACRLERAELAAALVAAVERRASRLLSEGLEALLVELGARDILRGRRVAVDGVEGVASGFDGLGHLLVRDDAGTTRSVVAGEVLWR